MAVTTNTTQNTCPLTSVFNPNQVVGFDVAPVTGPWSSNLICPGGQFQFITRQSGTGSQRPYFYTCADSIYHAQAKFKSQAANQTWPLQQVQTVQNVNNGTFQPPVQVCQYYSNDSNDVIAQQIKFSN